MSRLPRIFAFGNSHISIFSGKDTMVPIWPKRSIDVLPYFKTIRLGAPTAYQAMRHIYDILEVVRHGKIGFDRLTDTILLVFGEVDVRAHIILQAEKQNKSIELVTNEVVERYWEAIWELKYRGFKVAVFGCIAGFILKEDGAPSAWPHVGTLEQRNLATRIFNDGLEVLCKEKDVPFISVFEEMLEDDGITTKIKYLDEREAGYHLTTRMLPLIL